MNQRSIGWLFLAVTGTFTAPAAEFNSGAMPVALLELFTSEGCSSCPPAERWLAQLVDDPRLWREFVPVAFHVNYWDYIGWKDRFAAPAFTDRQRALAGSWPGGRVYTPCFVRNGEEWRTRDLTRRDTCAGGELSARTDGDGRVHVRFLAEKNVGECDGFVALLGGGITSDVKAGENSGRKLAHEFVALALGSQLLVADADGVLSADFDLKRASLAESPRRAVAVWVTRRGELAPLQATGGWLE